MSDDKAKAIERDRLEDQASRSGASQPYGGGDGGLAPPPAYDEPGSSSSSAAAQQPQQPQQPPPSADPGPLPTVESPFNFPSNADLPPYSPYAEGGPSSAFGFSSGSGSSSGPGLGPPQLPIALPQVKPDGASPLLSAYPPELLSRGITLQAWQSFVATTSAFLTAKVSDRALSHAADMAKHVGEGPKELGKSIASHAKSVGKGIASNAKRGNIVGAAMGIVGGAIAIPVVGALNTVGAASALPGSLVGAIVRKPQTPRQRAEAYAAVANKKWLHGRGLHAQLLSTVELANLLGMPPATLLDMLTQAKGSGAGAQLAALATHIASVDVDNKVTLELDSNTLWLVLIK